MTVDSALTLLDQTEEKIKSAKSFFDQKMDPSLDKIKQIVTILNVLKENVISKTGTNDSLTKELDEKTRKGTELVEAIQQKEKDFEELRGTRARESSKRDEQKNQIEGVKDQITELRSSIANCEEEIAQLEKTIASKEEQIARINDIRGQHLVKEEELNQFVEKQKAFERQCLALSHLIKESYITSPEVDVIKSLSMVGVNNKSRLLSSVNVSTSVVEGITKQLESKGLISIDEEGNIETKFDVEMFR